MKERMKLHDDMGPMVNERIERLICRRLDGELTREERLELDRALARDPAARALLNDYARNDALVAGALRRDFESAMTATAPGYRRGLWLATAGSVLVAAAVILFSALPTMQPDVSPDTSGPRTVIRQFPTPPTAPMRLIDYRNVDMRPAHRDRQIQRDVIGIRGEDKNKIYVIERGAAQTRVVPVAGEF